MLICIELRGAGPLRQHSRDARRAGLPQRWRPHRPGTEHQRPGRMVALLSAWKTGTQNFLIVQPIRKSIRSCYCWQRIGIQWELGDRIGSVPPPPPYSLPPTPLLRTRCASVSIWSWYWFENRSASTSRRVLMPCRKACLDPVPPAGWIQTGWETERPEWKSLSSVESISICRMEGNWLEDARRRIDARDTPVRVKNPSRSGGQRCHKRKHKDIVARTTESISALC